MKIQKYKKQTAKGKINVSAFYHHDYKLKVIVPTMVYNYLIDKIKEQPPFKGFKLDIAMYYLSLIISIPAAHKDKIYQYGYIPLDTEILKSKNYLYKQYFDYFFLEIQILEKKNYSTASHTCNRYRYNYKAIKSEGNECVDFSTFEITDKKFNEKLLEQDVCSDSFNSCPHLCKWFNDSLQIDFGGVINKYQSAFCYNKYQLYDKMNLVISKAYNYWYSALAIREKCFRTSRKPESDNRLHTNLTNMPSAFRPFVSYENETIVSLDIKNSQPYFLILLLERFEDIRIGKIMKNIYGSIGIMLQKLQTITSSKAFQEEFSSLKETVLNGTFYEYLGQFFDIKPEKIVVDTKDPNKKNEIYEMSFYNSDFGKNIKQSFEGKRSLMKKLTLQILYTPLAKPSKEYKIFKGNFPQLCSCIELFKTHTKDKNAYKQFPKLLQHIESNCVLDVITPVLAKQYPDMPLWTIHDSFCTTQQWFPMMEETINKAFYSYSGGIMPKLKPEYWSDEQNLANAA
ncbi:MULTISPECIES: hypothetical protein [Elizabethkingia]|uniref:hypothetical protein n=1 Tax=Elizabethkingia TaxID=308865 RepID=UPI0009361C6A|nr:MULTISPECIES: hypothetical protein [Elizabethkingia]